MCTIVFMASTAQERSCLPGTAQLEQQGVHPKEELWERVGIGEVWPVAIDRVKDWHEQLGKCLHGQEWWKKPFSFLFHL